jgi:hypothetical protein
MKIKNCHLPKRPFSLQKFFALSRLGLGRWYAFFFEVEIKVVVMREMF